MATASAGELAVQEPDPRPGRYYVSVRDGERWGLLVGPFENDHAAALALVDAARHEAWQLDPRAPWYSYGTCRLAPEVVNPPAGVLNAEFGLPCRKKGSTDDEQ